MKLRLVLYFLIFSLLSPLIMLDLQGNEKLLIPIGGGYNEIFDGFISSILSRANQNIVKILILPIAYGVDPQITTEVERAKNLQSAESRRLQIEEACRQAVPPGISCLTLLAPIFIHTDAENPNNLNFFSPDLTAIFILGGDQTIAMQVIAGTPIEKALDEAYRNGTVIAGTSAGAALQSTNMLSGYNPNYTNGNSLNFGALDVWNTPEKHGLLFGVKDSIIDQHFYQLGRFSRLLNAISMQGVPHLGIGIDAYTGVNIVDGKRLENVFGLFTVTILDAETYHSADLVQYIGAQSILSLRNILVHMLSPGDFSYDLLKRRPSLAAPPERIAREFDSLNLPKGAGPLVLGGNLSRHLVNNTILTNFINQSGGQKAKMLIVASGYDSDNLAQQAADQVLATLKLPAQTLVVTQGITQPVKLPAGITGVIFIGEDQSKIQPQFLTTIKDAWLSGTPLLVDNAATAIIGTYYSSHKPTPENQIEAEDSTQNSFLLGTTKIAKGLELLNLTVEPQIIDNNRWGRLFSLAYQHPELLALGITDNTALEITPFGAFIHGENVVFVLDLRSATLALGINQGFVISNGFVDVYAPGDLVRSQVADMNFVPLSISTPMIPTTTSLPPTITPSLTKTLTPTLTPPPLTATRTPKYTHTPHPTNTPPVIPPPGNLGLSNTMIFLALLAVIVVLIGVWINRSHLL